MRLHCRFTILLLSLAMFSAIVRGQDNPNTDPLIRVLEAKGEFVWTNDAGRVGVRFTTIAPLVKSELESWLSRQLEFAAPSLASAASGRSF